MFQYVTAIILANNDHMILLLENNGMRLDLYECGMDRHYLIAGWNTNDREQLRDAIIMIVLFVIQDHDLNEVYNSFTSSGKSGVLSDTQKKILYELAEARVSKAQIKLVIFEGSDMLPTIFNQPVDLAKSNIQLCLPHSTSVYDDDE
ncbi:MAG: hypothetical protein ABSH41_00885 [Syntrophobacteraceae bacterium]